MWHDFFQQCILKTRLLCTMYVQSKFHHVIRSKWLADIFKELFEIIDVHIDVHTHHKPPAHIIIIHTFIIKYYSILHNCKIKIIQFQSINIYTDIIYSVYYLYTWIIMITCCTKYLIKHRPIMKNTKISKSTLLKTYREL